MKHITVLIIEDSIYATDLNAREIKKAGFLVDFRMVTSRKAMLKAMNERKWNMIVSDNSIPNFNALQVLEIRNQVDATIPFIIVSEDVSQEDIQRAFENGCNAYLPKENLYELRTLAKKILKDI